MLGFQANCGLVSSRCDFSFLVRTTVMMLCDGLSNDDPRLA
jgi:hypothetical protein